MSLEEVAKRARVSISTVSRVLNGIAVVKASTRTKVMRSAAELNYHPNLNARSLARGKSRALGMVVSNLANPYFFDVFRALEKAAHAHGYEVLVANTDYSSDQLVKSVRTMIGRRVSGLAVIVSEMAPDLIDELTANEIPTVFHDVGTVTRNISNIRIDYRRAIERVVEYLHSLGHSRLAYIGHHSQLSPTSAREAAFLEAVSRWMPAATHRTVTAQDGFDGGRQAAREILASGERPTAIICVNDFMAVGALRELREQGLRVPEDVSVTGFDNIKLSEYCSPPLTTVHLPRDRIGQLAFDMLVPETVEGKPPGREVLIDPELVVRESTAPARKSVSPQHLTVKTRR